MTMATLTGTTCAANCWYAREPECRCSCAGANHGCLLVAGAEQPRRNCTIAGKRYVLGAVGFGMHTRSQAFRGSLDRETYGYHIGSQVFFPMENERNATVWVKCASVGQVTKWPEVAAVMADSRRRPYLLWVREDVVDQFDAMEG